MLCKVFKQKKNADIYSNIHEWFMTTPEAKVGGELGR